MEMTSAYRGIPIHIELRPPEGGVKEVSYAMCDQIRTVSIVARFVERWGAVEAATMRKIEYAVKVILGLK
jgi:mRNA interferase MazF